MSEIHDIVDVEVKGEYGVRVTSDDGAVREVSLEGQLGWAGVRAAEGPGAVCPSNRRLR